MTQRVVTKLDLKLPFWRYHGAVKDERYSFLLDSAIADGRLGRWSFLGGDPFLIFKATRRTGSFDASIDVTDIRSGNTTSLVGDAFEHLRTLLQEHRSEPQASGVPFQGGAIGYFGYEAGHLIEAYDDTGRDDYALPDIYLLFVDTVLAHRHDTNETFLSTTDPRALDCWRERINRVETQAETPPPPDVAPLQINLYADFDEPSYARAVDRIKRHIEAGDAYEVCLTHRLSCDFVGDPWRLYQELRGINPAPFASYLNLPEVQVVSSSPERFLQLGSDRVMETRPIKGTRRRGRDDAEDAALAADLAASEKDRAENLMIVDLLRNDFGRVAKVGSVTVPELWAVEKYASVFQLVSTVRGELAEGRDAIDLLRACFPGGSMTGAPKIAAMNIIDTLEPVTRGIYSGAIGYLDFAGAMDVSIVIRTILVQNGRAYLNAGGAVIADSDPHDEYEETLDKARALIAALQAANIPCEIPPSSY
jgi:aminodeoxychorismate synthase component I